jgi:MscS family membrane protein
MKKISTLIVLLIAFYGTKSFAVSALDDISHINTSSPRATLISFMNVVESGWSSEFNRLSDVRVTGRTLTNEDEVQLGLSNHQILSASRAFETENLPSELRREAERRLVVIMLSVLDRLEIPAIESIPDASAMAASSQKTWNIPGSPIYISQVKEGRRAGEYLFTSETMAHLNDYNDLISHLEPKHKSTRIFTDFFLYRPIDLSIVLGSVISPGWLFELPPWAMVRYDDRPVWRWMLLLASLVICISVFLLTSALRDLISARGKDSFWANICVPAAMGAVFKLMEILLRDIIHGTGFVFLYVEPALYLLFMGSMSWLTCVIGLRGMGLFIALRGVQPHGIDAKLIRIFFISTIAAIAISILYRAGNEVGLPTYSFIAGFSIIGMAASLSMQGAIGNFFSSLIIMFEKPFSVGDNVSVAGVSGTIEGIGFRSIRVIRNDGTCIFVPNARALETHIENYGPRKFRDISIGIKASRTNDQRLLSDFVSEVYRLLMAERNINHDTIEVGIHDFDSTSYSIITEFKLRAASDQEEAQYRQEIIFQMTNITGRLGVDLL